MQKFCFLCGKKTDKLIEGYCEECFEREFRLLRIPEKIELTVCSRCGSVKEGNRWSKITVEEGLARKLKILGFDVKLSIQKLDDHFHIYVKGFLKEGRKEKEERYHAHVSIKKSICNDCSRRASEHYEAIIQLRGQFDEEMVDTIIRYLDEKGTSLKVEDVKGGVDISVGSKSAAENVSERIKKQKKVELKKSFKLVTRKEGKNVYKTVISLRI